MERGDIHAFVARTDGYHEVLAQRNTIDPNACDPGHFDVQDRERDRIAFLAVDHFVQVAIFRVKKFPGVATEAFFFKKDFMHSVQEIVVCVLNCEF